MNSLNFNIVSFRPKKINIISNTYCSNLRQSVKGQSKKEKNTYLEE